MRCLTDSAIRDFLVGLGIVYVIVSIGIAIWAMLKHQSRSIPK